MAKAAQNVKTNEAPQTQAADTPKVTESTQEIQFDYSKLMEEHKSKSAVIRFLDSKGYKRGQIAKFMGIKYQFVRNVLITPVKKVA